MEYKTIKNFAEAEFVERKSRFIGSMAPVSSEEEAMAFVSRIREQYKDARHTAYAYLLRNGQRRYSDDGEPQGTAGNPALEVLTREGVVDVCVAMTRYFGGILLGGGGLIRAYSHTAKIALDAAEVVTMRLCAILCFCFDYTFYGKISNLCAGFTLQIFDTGFADTVRMECIVLEEEKERLIKDITNLTSGSVQVEQLGEQYANL